MSSRSWPGPLRPLGEALDANDRDIIELERAISENSEMKKKKKAIDTLREQSGAFKKKTLELRQAIAERQKVVARLTADVGRLQTEEAQIKESIAAEEKRNCALEDRLLGQLEFARRRGDWKMARLVELHSQECAQILDRSASKT
jgi:chromosome segregation ATPase